jgi:homoserine O-acetyltransferase
MRARQQTGDLGDFRLASGDHIRSCTIGYRTCGRLNPSRSNAVIVAPWFQGTSGQLVRQIGPGRLVDSSRYFVIAFDALGNGISSSPSTSPAQRGGDFPAFTIGDMVESQHQIVTRAFGLTHLHAVVGISMGGMQVHQWMADHPDFMDCAVSIVGSPQSQDDDRARWQAYIAALQEKSAWRRSMLALSRLKLRTALNELRIDPHDHTRQAQAIMRLDIAAPFGGSLTRAAAVTRARLLVVGAWTDREVNPTPAFEFARAARADVLVLDGRCGHQAPSCEQATVWPAVDRFLERGAARGLTTYVQ